MSSYKLPKFAKYIISHVWKLLAGSTLNQLYLVSLDGQEHRNNKLAVWDACLRRNPLWKRTIPQYPLYWKGNPQLRVFMPLFWMKLVKPEEKVPQGSVRFEVHPQLLVSSLTLYLHVECGGTVVRALDYQENPALLMCRTLGKFKMTKYDIKNYLEKIYKVPVQSVATEMIRGKERKHPTYGYNIEPKDNVKMAIVQLAEGQHFEFPELFKGKKTESEKSTEDFRKAVNDSRKEMPKVWDRMDLPPWFR